MNKSFKSVLITLAVGCTATFAHAASLKIHTNAVSNGAQAGSFSIDPLSGPVNNSQYHPWAKLTPDTFESFCLEPREEFTPGLEYQYTLAGAAMMGDFEAPGRNMTPGDQLSKGTTWLYSQFAQGMLNGFNYAWSTDAEKADRRQSNLMLQRAIWYLEDDYSAYNPASALLNPFLSLVSWKFGSLTDAQNDAATGAYGVLAINTYLTHEDKAGIIYNEQFQSQLWYGGHGVPDAAATLGLFGAAFGALLAFRRRSSGAV